MKSKTRSGAGYSAAKDDENVHFVTHFAKIPPPCS
jgi:hypothetical protein